MKKIVSVVMAAVMVCMSTAGCSGQKTAAGRNGKQSDRGWV